MTLDTVRAEIEKKYGITTSLDAVVSNIDSIPTGILSLDKILGVGGLPKGRIIEVFGEEASGKTFITLMAMASVQAAGGKVCFIDVEQAFDDKWAVANGVSLSSDNMIFVQPDFAEQALDIALDASKGGVDLIVLDSIAALSSQNETEGEMGDHHVGQVARLMNRFCRVVVPHLNNTDCTIVLINQQRDKIGVVYGNPKVTTGGHAMKYFASVRLLTSSNASGKIEVKGSYVGQKIKVRCVKNKVASPYRETTFDIDFKTGYSLAGNVIDLAVDSGFIIKKGAWFQYDEIDTGTGEITEHKLHGKMGMETFLTDRPDILEIVKQKVLSEGEEDVERIAMDESI